MPPLPVTLKEDTVMPEQDLWRFDKKMRRGLPLDWHGVWRRPVIFLSAFIMTMLFIMEFYNILHVGGITVLQIVLLILFAINLYWLSLSFMTALAGFITLIFGTRHPIVRLQRPEEIGKLNSRTAILIPTYNESPEQIFGTARAVSEALISLSDVSCNFDIFVLSDTTDPDIWVQEEVAFNALRAKSMSGPRLYYRRRTKNIGKKAGNIANWCKNWGASYDYMVVFDADSLMTGETLLALVDAMERNPDVALIQTSPILINQHTLFARLQQFATRVYGPVISAGLAFWHRGEGNFWGHNAIIRTYAFQACAGLPSLKGCPPFGGAILSHDFVEAALLRRMGWQVCMANELGGSYEESPPSLIDFAIRDRRWCQGNLQHARILLAKGFHWVSRVHLTMGIMSYVSALLWLIFLAVGIALSVQAQLIQPEYFGGEFTLFPTWPVFDSERAIGLLFATLALLLLPKIFGYLVIIIDPEKSREFSDSGRLGASIVFETVLSALLAPVMMAVQSAAIVDILRGRDSGWKPQSRDDGTFSVKEIFLYHFNHMFFGLILLVGTLSVSTMLFVWMSPAILGLVLSGPISAITTSRHYGAYAKRLGLLVIPEEVTPPKVALRASQCGKEIAAEAKGDEALTRLAKDPGLQLLHTRLLPCQPAISASQINVDLAVARAKLEASHTLNELIVSLSQAEKMALLSDADSILRLRTLFETAGVQKTEHYSTHPHAETHDQTG